MNRIKRISRYVCKDDSTNITLDRERTDRIFVMPPDYVSVSAAGNASKDQQLLIESGLGTASIVDTGHAFIGKPYTPAYKKSRVAKTYSPLVYGKKFKPCDLGNLVAWFCAEDLADEWISDGNSVDRWINRVRNGGDITQSTTNSQPTFQMGWNEKPCLSFDGVDDKLFGSITIGASSNLSIYMVVKLPVRAPSTVQYMLNNQTNASIPSIRNETNSALYGNLIRPFSALAGSGMGYYANKSPNAPYQLLFSTHRSGASTASQIAVVGNYPYSSHYYYTPDAAISNSANWVLALGGSASANFFRGEIYEVCVFSTAHLAPVELEMMKAYFSGKYNFEEIWA